MLKESPKEDQKKLSKDAQTIIGRLISASKNLKLYPASHPITKRIISSSFTKLKDVLQDNDFFTLSLAGNVLLINDKPAHIVHKQTIDTFLTILGKRKIGKITFLKGVDMDEFSSLIELLGLDPEDIEKQGGVTKIMSIRNVQHITIRGLSFGEEEDTKESSIKWKDLLTLITSSDDFIKNIGKNPKEFSKTINNSLKGDEGEPGWGSKIKQAVGNIAERLFNMYEKTDIETYTETVSKLILVLTPEMQRELLFSKHDIPFWDDVVNKVVNEITASELGDLIAKETKILSETVIIGDGDGAGSGTGGGVGDGVGGGVNGTSAPEGGAGSGTESTGDTDPLKVLVTGGAEEKSRLSYIEKFFSNFIDKSKRKSELIPAIRKSLQSEGVKQPVLNYMSGGDTRKEFLEIIEKDLIRTGVDSDALMGIRNLIQKNAGIEELLKSLIDLLNNKNPNIRRNVVKSFTDLTDKLLLLGRLDLIKLIIVAFSDRLGRESEKEIFSNIIHALAEIAVKLIKEGKGLQAEMIDEILNLYLKTLEDEEKLKPVVIALSKIGDQGDQKALHNLIYAINRDVAYGFINTELAEKGSAIFPLLLHSMKAIEDKITRIRVLSLLIDSANNVPDFDNYIKIYIEDPKWYVRRNIAIILGEIGGGKSSNLLSLLLKDPEPRVRIEVMESLSKIKNEDCEALLLEGLKDSNKEVVIRTLTSLRKVGTELSIYLLKELLEKQSLLKKEKVLEIQKRTVAVLGSIGGKRVIDIFESVIFNKNIFGRYKFNDKIRLLCVDTLGKMDTDISRHILTRASWLKNQEVGKRAQEILKGVSLV